MNNHRYILEAYKGMKTRYKCPSCQQNIKTFTRYVDTTTGQHVHFSVGRCSRESNCGFHYTPKKYFRDTGILIDNRQREKNASLLNIVTKQNPVSFIPNEIFEQSLQIGRNVFQLAEKNNFIKFLIEFFGSKIATSLVRKYYIGASKHWFGASVFWQIDISGKIRTGKIMLYNQTTGKRVKDPYNHITWAHKFLQPQEFELKQCFFGEHLLKIYPFKSVAIVESEKTAIIASVYLPQFTWLAAGSLSNLTIEKCLVLERLQVILFPDLNGFEKWSKKKEELSCIGQFSVSNLLESRSTQEERKQGLDLADYLIQFDWKKFGY